MSQLGYDLADQGFKIQENVVIACNGIGLKNMLQAGRQWLETHVDVVNALNVFPVPDGDTGTNMLLTMRSALEEVGQTANHHVETIAAAAARGALMGARGNSGVILSQFLQGLAVGLKGKVNFTAEDFAYATDLGVGQAYQGVINPVEGTILTVVRAAAEAARHSVKTNQDLVILLTDMLAAAKIAQINTPELLPVLKEAGVTDSGGQGLLYILEGGLRFMTNEPVDVDPVGEAIPILQSNLGVDEKTFGYDVQFLIRGEQLNLEEIRDHIGSLGWSTMVVGDERLVKVHVHANDPGLPISYGASQGVISDVVVESLEQLAREFVHDRAAPRPLFQSPADTSSVDKAAGPHIAAVSIVPGQGLADIFQSLGVSRIVPGGQTMNPSTQEILDVIKQVEPDQVLVLPNNKNVILAARQAQELSEKHVEVIPTETVPQGIAALLSFNDQADFDTNVRRMLDAARDVQTIEIVQAVRDTSLGGLNIKSGDIMGLFNGRLMRVDQNHNEVTLDLLSQIEIDAYEIVTIYFGQGSSPEQAQTLANRINELYPEIGVEVYDGGQPHHHYIISVE
jgi:DAK2 domain fusion protein YloV